MPAGPSGVDQQRGEPLHPPVYAYVIDGDAPLGQQFFDVSVDIPGVGMSSGGLVDTV
jgi:hypothetical protein